MAQLWQKEEFVGISKNIPTNRMVNPPHMDGALRYEISGNYWLHSVSILPF
jgi:hypothetical protein